MKKQAMIIAISTLLLGGCGTDEAATDSAEKSSLEKAAEHAKASAKELGNALSESTESVRDKWSEMNQDRHEAPTGEETLPPSEKADMDAIKEKYEEVKQATIEKTEEVVDKVKEMTGTSEEATE